MRTISKYTGKAMLIQRISDLRYIRDEGTVWPVYWTDNPRLARTFKSEQALKSYMTALIKGIVKAEGIQAGLHNQQLSWKDYKYKYGDLNPLKDTRVVTTYHETIVTAEDTLVPTDMEELFEKPLFAKKMGIKYVRPNKKVIIKAS